MANGEAIGLIETKGIVAAVEACDAALKAANVQFVEQHKVGSGLVAITLRGDVVATHKDKVLNGQKLLVIEPLNVKYDDSNKPASLGNTGRAIVAIDVVGCGEGQLVLVVQGSSARMTEQTKNLPADAAIIGIVDSAQYGGKTFT